MEIGFIHVHGKTWRPVIVYKFNEDGEPLDYTYFADSKQMEIIQRVQRLKMSARIQVAATRRSEDLEIEEDLRV